MEESRADLYKQVKEKRNAQGRDTYRIITEPILSLPLLSIILCNLHCLMAIMQKVVQLPLTFECVFSVSNITS
jgi:hypothetical protein